MEKHIPGLKRLYNRHLHRLRLSGADMDKATKELAIWSERYREAVTDEESYPYGGILNAYAMREALKQYIEELKGSQNNFRT